MKPPVPLYLYQRQWFMNRSRFKIGMFSRQSGKTFTTTMEIVDSCLEAEASGRKERWVILSRGERQAREAMEEGVKRHAQAYEAALQVRESAWAGSEATYHVMEARLAGGSRISALPANPDTARGFSANVFLDEFAFHADSHKIWKALFPVISAGHKLRVVSTPNGKGNKFYELMTGKDKLWYRQTTDIYQAVADGLPRDIEELKTGLSDPDGWAQEYELQWLDEASAWLSYELIASVEHEDAGDPTQARTGGEYYIGVDIASRNDLWCAVVLERVGDVLWLRELATLRRKSFAEQDVVLDGLVNHYQPVRICKDQSGMGEKPVEDAKRRYGEYRVEGLVFTGPTKQLLATQAKQQFEQGKIRIPPDRALRDDLHALKKTTTATGAPRFDAERNANGHADRAWALFLAIHAASGPKPVIGDFTPIGGSSWDFGNPDEDDWEDWN